LPFTTWLLFALLDKAVEHDIRIVQIADKLLLHELNDVELDRLSQQC
jgi:hypothetical protein